MKGDFRIDKNTVCLPRQGPVTTDVAALVGQIEASRVNRRISDYGFTTPPGSEIINGFLLFSVVVMKIHYILQKVF